MSHVQEKVQFCESRKKKVQFKRRVLFCESSEKEGFNSVSHIFQKKVQFLE